jgi:hypothetical protein
VILPNLNALNTSLPILEFSSGQHHGHCHTQTLLRFFLPFTDLLVGAGTGCSTEEAVNVCTEKIALVSII